MAVVNAEGRVEGSGGERVRKKKKTYSAETVKHLPRLVLVAQPEMRRGHVPRWIREGAGWGR